MFHVIEEFNVFHPVNPKQGWLVISGIVSWLPIGQQCLIDFFCRSRLIPISWRSLQIVRQRPKKLLMQHHPLLVRHLQQANQVLPKVNYTVLHLWSVMVDKNKSLTLSTLSRQPKILH
jgi:hypothetical protein